MPETSKQAIAERKYASLKQAVEAAGFFALHVQVMGEWDQLTCTSKYLKGYGYTGSIIFVTTLGGQWFFNTPHPYCYRVRDAALVAQVVIAYLNLDRKKKQPKNSEHVDLGKELVQIEYEEFQQACLEGG